MVILVLWFYKCALMIKDVPGPNFTTFQILILKYIKKDRTFVLSSSTFNVYVLRILRPENRPSEIIFQKLFRL